MVNGVEVIHIAGTAGPGWSAGVAAVGVLLLVAASVWMLSPRWRWRLRHLATTILALTVAAIMLIVLTGHLTLR